MNVNTAQRLIKGSAEIDRMRKEIVMIVNMIVGPITNDPVLLKQVKEHSRALRGAEGDWWVNVYGDAVAINYYSTMDGAVFRAHLGRDPVVPMKFVSRVHFNLPVLVEEVVKTFPRIAFHWQPLLEAADCAQP